MTINLQLAPVISLIAGIAILLVPKLMRYILGVYLIIFGIIGLMNL